MKEDQLRQERELDYGPPPLKALLHPCHPALTLRPPLYASTFSPCPNTSRTLPCYLCIIKQTLVY